MDVGHDHVGTFAAADRGNADAQTAAGTGHDLTVMTDSIETVRMMAL